MKYIKCKDGSYVTNCYVKRRETDPSPYLFFQTPDGESLRPHLNGYAIIPIEEYRELTGQDVGISEAQIDRANKDFYGKI